MRCTVQAVQDRNLALVATTTKPDLVGDPCHIYFNFHFCFLYWLAWLFALASAMRQGNSERLLISCRRRLLRCAAQSSPPPTRRETPPPWLTFLCVVPHGDGIGDAPRLDVRRLIIGDFSLRRSFTQKQSSPFDQGRVLTGRA